VSTGFRVAMKQDKSEEILFLNFLIEWKVWICFMYKKSDSNIILTENLFWILEDSP
jgi:hypothetical protein